MPVQELESLSPFDKRVADGGLATSPASVGGWLHDPEMQIDPANLLSLITACVVAVITASLTPWFTSRAERKRELRERNREASADLAASLRALRTLLRRRGHLPVSPREVSNAVGAWTEVWDRRKHLVPATCSSAGSSVRAAVGEVFGAVALVDLRPDLSDYPLAGPGLHMAGLRGVLHRPRAQRAGPLGRRDSGGAQTDLELRPVAHQHRSPQ